MALDQDQFVSKGGVKPARIKWIRSKFIRIYQKNVKIFFSRDFFRIKFAMFFCYTYNYTWSFN